MQPPRICIVCQNASMKFGGEAGLPWLLFQHLRARGVDALLVAHHRTHAELETAFAADRDRLFLAEETRIDRILFRLGKLLPGKIDAQTFGILRHIYNQKLQRRIVRKLIAEKGITIVHEINPVSPKQVSLMYGLGVPVVIGPLAGGMTYPPGFRFMEPRGARAVEAVGRMISHLINRLLPGKRRANGLIVANDQARDALPGGVRGKIFQIPDVGVDLTVWSQADQPQSRNDSLIRFVYLGRLADWKGVRYLLEAFARVAGQIEKSELEILGDGEERADLQRRTEQLGLSGRVNFAGWVSAEEGAKRLRQADVFVLPSLHEVGGIALLEAMAVGLPVIAADWGGPASHVTEETGIRVPPKSPEQFVQGLTAAMARLARSPDLRRHMGDAGRKRVTENLYDWNQKTDRFLEIYAELMREHRPF